MTPGKLRRTRLKLELTQLELAKRSGVSRFKICTYELGYGKLNKVDASNIEEALSDSNKKIKSK